ncbi:hypothetical protein Q5Y75_05720 [Ruegeria sp. 2205SS24-7]|uniref:hypothetical protein n=1 Tax=Ruegeria discodermiae TaxID=3064389 RepID=UPI002740F1A0|nr:hypothetical protein [Ruegeria sp. 2205SS24-7]MDP5216709.1 hypothetical protein [Ruegeria sp. 2205SS24-7]
MSELTLVERLKVAKHSGMEVQFRLSPEDAGAFADLFEVLSPKRLATMKANQEARRKRTEKVERWANWAFLVWLAIWASWIPIASAMQVFGQ